MQLPPTASSALHSSSAAPPAVSAVPAVTASTGIPAPQAAIAAAVGSALASGPNPVASATGAPAQATAPVASAAGPQTGHQAQPGAINYSSETIIHPSQFVDPGHGSFFASITLGRPIGIITDLVMFFDLLKRNKKMCYTIYGTFLEARAFYETQYDRYQVKLTEHLATPLPSVAPGSAVNPIMISSAAPTPVRPVARVPRNRHLFPHTVIGPRSGPAAQRQTAATNTAQDEESNADDDSPPSSPNLVAQALAESLPPSSPPPPPSSPYVDVSDVQSDAEVAPDASLDTEKLPIGQAEVITDEDDPRLSHIAKYPRRLTRRNGGRLVERPRSEPPRDLSPVQQVIVSTNDRGEIVLINPVLTGRPLGHDADPSRDLSAADYPDVVPNPFRTAPIRSSPAIAKSKKRTEHPADEDSAPGISRANTEPKEEMAASKKRRFNIIQSVMAQGSNSGPASDVFGLNASTSAGSSSLQPAAMLSPLRHNQTGSLLTPARSNAGQRSPDFVNSDTDWGLEEYSHQDLDSVPELMLPSPPSPKMKKSNKKGKARQRD